MNVLPWGLGCPACPRIFQVSEVDPDASLSEVVSHLRSRHADAGSLNNLIVKIRDVENPAGDR
jgi:hypothetical protein